MLLALSMLMALLPASAFAEESAGGLVQLHFTSTQASDVEHVTLVDASGNPVLSLSDVPGTYLLAPGAYTYYLIDPSGAGVTVPATALLLDGGESTVEIALRDEQTVPAPQEAPTIVRTEAQPETRSVSQEIQAMPVVFRGEAGFDAAGLTVTDASGAVMQPYTDPLTGQMQFENYLLVPGQYSYWTHDPTGRLADGQGSFTVTESGVQYVTVGQPEGTVEGCYSATAVNPYYADVIRADFIPAPSTSPEESLTQLMLEVGDLSASRRYSINAVYGAESSATASAVVFDSPEAAGAALKRGLIQRQSEITIRVKCGIKPTEEIWWSMCLMIYDEAIRHTGAPTEGDYLRYEYGGVNCNGSALGTKEPDVYYYEFIYSPLYFTTQAQEAELSEKVDAILTGLNLGDKTAEQKIRAVYQYLCSNVRYEEAQNTLAFTAYNALVKGSAACQGISVAFYRMCLALGLDARIVTSRDMGHAWNIVRADDKNYYALDATWDLGKTPEQWKFYLRGRVNWKTEHTLGDEFEEGRFASYTFPDEDYGSVSGAVIHSVSLLFEGMLQVKYYFLFSDDLLTEPGIALTFSRDGKEFSRKNLSEGKVEKDYLCFYCDVNVEDIAEPIQARVQKRDGSYIPIRTVTGTSYPNGFFFSPMDYATSKKTTGTTANMRALAQALEDYGVAAQNFFKDRALDLRDEVKNVKSQDLSAWAAKTEGKLPAGVTGTSFSVMFKADNSLRIYLEFDRNSNPGQYSYKIDGNSVALKNKSDGVFYLTVENIAANALDTKHSFSISDGKDTYVIETSALGYAKSAIDHGGAAMADLGRALYLYNRAADRYFGG